MAEKKPEKHLEREGAGRRTGQQQPLPGQGQRTPGEAGRTGGTPRRGEKEPKELE